MIRSGVAIKFAKRMANPLQLHGDLQKLKKKHAIRSGVAIKFAKV